MTTFSVPLHKGQRLVLDSMKRLIYMVAGSGGGKTVLGPVWLIREIERNRAQPERHQQYLVASPTFPLLVRTTFPAVKGYLEAMGAEWKATERRFKLPWGTDEHGHPGPSVWVGSADNPASLEGVHLRAAWCDEFGQVDDLGHDTVIRRLAMLLGRVLFTTTPYKSTGWVRRVRDAAQSGDPDVDYITFPSWWNPAYPIEEYKRLKRTLPPWQAAMFLDAMLTRPEGLIYPEWSPAHHIVPRFDIPHEWERFAGYDAGANNPTAILMAARSGDDVLYIFDELYQPGMTTPTYAAWLKDRVPQLVFADPSAKQVIIDLRAHNVSAYPAENAVIVGVSEVHERLATDRLFVLAGAAPNLVREIEAYVWTENKDAPVKENDHAVDALRYLAMGIRARARGRATIRF